jgi:hypothetical protein
MRFIPTRVHGMLDYLMGVLLIGAPWLLNFARGGAETYVPVVLGIGVILYSLLTRYELGAVRVLPMSAHLAMDFFGGLLLAVSPWLFGFADYIAWPHVTFGILEMGAALMTQRTPSIAHDTLGAHRTDDHHRGDVAHV